MTGFGVPLGLWHAFVSNPLPDDFARALVQRVNLPGVLSHVGVRFNVAVKTVAKRFLVGRITADGGDDKHPVAPDNRAGEGKSGNGHLPQDVLTLDGVPFRRSRFAVGNARGALTAE